MGGGRVSIEQIRAQILRGVDDRANKNVVGFLRVKNVVRLVAVAAIAVIAWHDDDEMPAVMMSAVVNLIDDAGLAVIGNGLRGSTDPRRNASFSCKAANPEACNCQHSNGEDFFLLYLPLVSRTRRLVPRYQFIYSTPSTV